MVVQESNLPYFQLGPVPWSTMGLIAKAATTFSLARKNVSVARPPYHPDRLPIWHSVFLRNGKNLSYYSPALMCKGITTLGWFMSHYHKRLRTVAHTYKSPVRRAWMVCDMILVRSEAGRRP